MFTGIVEEIGTIAGRVAGDVVTTFRVHAPTVTSDAHIGDSIALNGCCLTITALGDDWYDCDAVPETLSRTKLGGLRIGDAVNLERSVRLSDRLGGHLVQGHVDGVGEVVDPAPDLRLRVPSALLKYIVEKGSITIDGTSLTVVTPLDDGFTVAVIPHTESVTTIGALRRGDLVNLEVDVMAKYAERLIAAHFPQSAPPQG